MRSAGMRAMDRRAVEFYGVPVRALMEAAGASLAREACELRGAHPGPVVLLCGGGHNGGDGLACARHLHTRGVPVQVYLWAEPDRLDEAPRGNWDALARMDLPRTVTPGSVPASLPEVLAGASAIVDCLVGTGFRGRLRPPLDAVVAAVNRSGRPVLAADVPSGVDADGGPVEGPCVRATRTLCLGAAKYGCFVYPGAAFAGEVRVDPIGIPADRGSDDDPIRLVTPSDVAAAVPHRRPDGHKGTFGHVLVVGGSTGFSGAPALAARGALAAGAGLVTVGAPEPVVGVLAAQLTEIMVRPLGSALQDVLPGADAVVLGPGLGRAPEAAHAVEAVLTSGWRGVLVVDADGLFPVRPRDLAGCAADVVITPHPGEMGRLLGRSTAEVQADRLAAAREAAREAGCVAVLKGARTLVAEPGGCAWVNPTGNDGMGTGGTGDVLAGIVAGLAAQGASARDAAVAGVYLHGLAGDRAARRLGRRGLTAGEVVRSLAGAFREVLPPGAF